MNIRTYKGDFSYAIFQRGQTYFRQKKLKEVTCDGSGNYRFIVGFNAGLIVLGVAGVIMPTTSALLHNTSTLAIGLKSMGNLNI